MAQKFKQAVLSLPAQAMTERNLKSDQDCEKRMTKEKESTMTILATEKHGMWSVLQNRVHQEDSNKTELETNLEERYGIMVAVENADGQFGNLTAEESLQQAPVLNNTETDMVSEIPAAPEGAETFIQEREQDNGNHIVSDEGEEDYNECQNDGGEGDGEEDYLFPSPEDAEQARPPEVGMVFATLQDAHRFLNVYGLVTGFVMRKGRNYKHKKITFMCNKSGKTIERETGKRKRRCNAIDRTGCPMKVLVKLIAGRWEVAVVKNEHNHPLESLPSLTKFFVSHKYMSEEERIFSRILQESKIKPAEIMEIFRKLRCRLKNIPVQKMDVNNLKQTERQAGTKNTDIASTLDHIKIIQKEQPGFIYTINTDDSNSVRSLFWTDSQARLDYALYGDFILLDTSYTTTENNMLFSPLVGINGHGKAIVFGCALLENDMAETLSWLFRTFLDVMDGKKPSIIITHQGSAMQKSVAEAFPNVFHRFSMWHVMREAAAEFGGSVADRPGLQAELTRLVTNSLTTEEFEDGWKAMLQKYDAASNAHLNLMYQTRLMWVPVYFKHAFCPFIRSFGWSESTNPIFKDVLQVDTVENFFRQYDIFQKEVARIEVEYRSESTPKMPMYCTRQPIERQAAEIYTIGLFLKFQKELLDASAFNVFEMEKGRSYTVKKTLDYEEAEFISDSFSIEVDMKTNMFKCICSKFERDGILCSHVLRIFTQLGINEIPEHYIKERWTKKYKKSTVGRA